MTTTNLLNDANSSCEEKNSNRKVDKYRYIRYIVTKNYVYFCVLEMRVVALITMVVYVWFLSKPLVSAVDFFVNQKEITEELCENKDEPILECNGKCYLMKTLQEDNNPFESNIEVEKDEQKKDSKNSSEKKQTKSNIKVYEVIPLGISIAETYRLNPEKNYKPYLAFMSNYSLDLLIPPPKA